ncbi:hypothetical protein [Bacillus cereus]|nr:hypothetical protein [Bacillus cereus]
MRLPWDCEACGHNWTDSPFVTYVECPKCGSDCVGHGDMIESEEEAVESK